MQTKFFAATWVRSLTALATATAVAVGTALGIPAAHAQSSKSDIQALVTLSSALGEALSETSVRSVLSINNRSFILHVPATYDSSRRYPVIFAYGGMGHTAQQAESYMHFESVATDALVVYPQMIGTSPSSGWEGPAYGPSRGTDVAFTKQILHYLKGKYSIDSSRVYATGLSNGGGMALALACQAPELFSAVAGVATASYTPIFNYCSGQVDTLLIHGSDDAVAPFDHDGVNGHGGNYYSAQKAWRIIGQRNHCDTSHYRAYSGDGYTAYSLNSCAADTTLYRVADGIHTWFPSNPTATREVWNYFQTH